MEYDAFLKLLEKGGRRYQLLGSEQAGVIAGLDLEGRLFVVLDGNVVNRVNPEACLRNAVENEYLNPGGDGLWPAPEGSLLGYEYATGAWRVPPGVSGARYRVADLGADNMVIRARIDLINASGLGVPALFERNVRLDGHPQGLAITTTESITYLGTRSLPRTDCLLAPWTLCQFDCGPGCGVLFPLVEPEAIRDLYDPSSDQRTRRDEGWFTRTDGAKRYQIGLPERVAWIEYSDPERNLRVRRTTEALPPGMEHIDIADRPADQKPDGPGVRLSVYSDPEGFMEIEAAGGCPSRLSPGHVSTLEVRTEYGRTT